MTIEVRNLTHSLNSKPYIHLLPAHWGVKRVVYEVGYQCSKHPVVGTVPVHIGKRRSRMAEAMNKECFKLPLGIMKAPGIQCIGLDRVGDLASWKTKEVVNLWIEVEYRVDDQWPQVLKEEKCLVCHLRPQVLEHNLWVLVAEIVLQLLATFQYSWPLLPRLQGHRQPLSFRVVLGILALNSLLQISNSPLQPIPNNIIM